GGRAARNASRVHEDAPPEWDTPKHGENEWECAGMCLAHTDAIAFDSTRRVRAGRSRRFLRTQETPDQMHSTDYPSRLTRRRMSLLLGGSGAGVGLLAVSGAASAEAGPREQQARLSDVVAAALAPPALAATSAAAQAGAPLAGFKQATQSSFNPINSAL